MLEKISLVLCVLCVLVLLALVSSLEQTGRLDQLFSRKVGNTVIRYDYLKYVSYLICLLLPTGFHVFLSNWISIIIFSAIVFLYVGYRIGLSKRSDNGGAP